ncbi:ABC transporter permease [Virgisporangium aurantiacum]|uniref:Sugar ABC transporter permease n=1 Tax=Virgisporangium aurantiacum TaxID=175570 RepID=A0A8J4E1Y6_9ACTN|nr:ABC transporter permease [Virgisporangium aurantiacum]GIJ59260.1 sugar ABC transporter permease [Virgisporangium aurantiacum]
MTMAAVVGRTDSDQAHVRWLVFARDRGIFVLWALLLIGFSVWARPYFGTVDNAILIANAAALTAVFAAGIAVGIICGALDLSIPGTAAMAGCVCGWLMTHDVPVWLGIAAGLAVGVVVGLVNGLIALRGFNPIIVTIGTLSVLSGLASALAAGYTIPGLLGLEFMGTRRYAGVPAPVWIVAALFLAGTVFLTRTRDGIRLMAVGGNAEAVRRSGIHSDRYKVLAFVISGFCAALGGLMTAALVTEANPAANPGIIFNALTAVALAGVSLSGGRGSLPRVLVGALILGTISNGLTLKGIQPFWATTVTGALLLASLGLEKWVSTTVSRRLVTTAAASAHTESKDQA